MYQNGENIPKRGKYTKLPPNYRRAKIHQNGRNKFQMALEFNNFFIPRLSKIYPNWDCWFENIRSGKPAKIPDINRKDN
jgi:hypothetical protein